MLPSGCCLQNVKLSGAPSKLLINELAKGRAVSRLVLPPPGARARKVDHQEKALANSLPLDLLHETPLRLELGVLEDPKLSDENKG